MGRDCQVRQKTVDLGEPHLLRVSLAVKENEPTDPADAGPPRIPRKVPSGRLVGNAVEQTRVAAVRRGLAIAT